MCANRLGLFVFFFFFLRFFSLVFFFLAASPCHAFTPISNFLLALRSLDKNYRRPTFLLGTWMLLAMLQVDAIEFCQWQAFDDSPFFFFSILFRRHQLSLHSKWDKFRNEVHLMINSRTNGRMKISKFKQCQFQCSTILFFLFFLCEFNPPVGAQAKRLFPKDKIFFFRFFLFWNVHTKDKRNRRQIEFWWLCWRKRAHISMAWLVSVSRQNENEAPFQWWNAFDYQTENTQRINVKMPAARITTSW